MPRYLIEREIPDIGSAGDEAYKGAAQKSNTVLCSMKSSGKNIQWEHSYVSENKIFCIYLADSEAEIKQHAEESGFPANKITPITKVIDPVTAE